MTNFLNLDENVYLGKCGKVEVLPNFEVNVYMIEGSQQYKIGFHPLAVARILDVSEKSLASDLYGERQGSYWPRKYIAEYPTPNIWQDGGDIIVLRDVPHTEQGGTVHAVIPMQALKNIIFAYNFGYVEGRLRADIQDRIGKRCTVLFRQFLTPDVEYKIMESIGYNPYMHRKFEKVYEDPVFELEYPYLQEILLEIYPEREEFKYKALCKTIFQYAYEDVIGKAALKKLKEKRNVFEPLHKYIAGGRVREKLRMYITIFTTVIKMLQIHELFDSRAKSKTHQAREETVRIMKYGGVI